MRLSDLIKLLEELKEQHGDLAVRTQTLGHIWDPEPEVRGVKNEVGDSRYILLNP